MKYLGLLFLTAILLLGFLLLRDLEQTTEKKSPRLNLLQEVPCDLQLEICRIESEKYGSITVSITPRPFKMNDYLKINVYFEKPVIYSVYMDFLGLDIDMGYSRPQLTSLDKNLFDGQTLLPMCSLQQMSWQGSLIIDLGSALDVFRFEFVTEGTAK